MARIKLHEIAHGRAGDKGNRLNIGLFPYHTDLWPILLAEVTAEKVLAVFRHRGATEVARYVLPKLPAMNFVIDEALEGGVNSSLALDAHGKTHSFRLLDMEIEIDDALLPSLKDETSGARLSQTAELATGNSK